MSNIFQRLDELHDFIQEDIEEANRLQDAIDELTMERDPLVDDARTRADEAFDLVEALGEEHKDYEAAYDEYLRLSELVDTIEA